MSQRLVAGLLALLLVVFVGVPLALLVGQALDPEVWSVALEPVNLAALKNTLFLAVGVALFTLAVGLPIGFLLGRCALPFGGLWRPLLSLPYVVPPYIGAIAWIQLLNPTNGLVNRVLVPLGLPAFDIYTLGGMVWVLGLFLSPFVFLGTADALGRINPALEDAARMSGAGPFRTVLDVTLPMAIPSVLAGAGFVIAASAAAFGVPYLLASGTASPDWVLTTRIYQALALDPSTGQPIAVVLSLVLLVVGIGLPAVLSRIEGRRSFVGVTGKANRGGRIELGPWTPVAVLFLLLYALVAVVLPMGTILVTSFLVSFGGGLQSGNFTLDHWNAVLFERGDTMDALGRSAYLAAGAATAAVAVGGVLSWMSARSRGNSMKLVTWFAKLPYAVPGTVLALGMILAFSQEVRFILAERLTLTLALMDTAWLLGIAYAVKYLAFPVGNVGAAARGVDPTLEEAARLSGATWWQALRDVTFPLLTPAIIASWFLVAMPAFSEVTMSILLFGPRTPVVGTVLFNLQEYADPPAAAVLAVVVTLVVLALNASVRLLSRGRLGL